MNNLIEKGKISSLQMALLLYPTIVITAYLITPSETNAYAHHDMWFSPIAASVSGFLTVYISYKLHMYYPGKTIIQIFEEILGKILGKIVSISYTLMLLYLAAYVLREYEEAIIMVILPRTPSVVIDMGFLLLTSFAIKGGIEILGRLSNLFVPLIIFALVFLLVFTLKDLNPKYFLPSFKDGIVPPLRGGITTQALFSEFIFMSMLFPFISDQKKALKAGLLSVFMVMVSLVTMNIDVLFLFGNVLEDFTYPLVNVGRYIRIADFFEHLESVVISIWILGAFLKLCVFHYIGTLGLAQTFHFKDFRPFVYPVGIFIILFSYWGLNSYQEMVQHFRILSVTLIPAFFIFFPLLILVISMFKNRKGNKEHQMV